jgi:hypothetical protein
MQCVSAKKPKKTVVLWKESGQPATQTANSGIETGLYYYGARYLDPRTSRWLSADPAMGEYVPRAGNGVRGLPGLGGVYNIRLV